MNKRIFQLVLVLALTTSACKKDNSSADQPIIDVFSDENIDLSGIHVCTERLPDDEIWSEDTRLVGFKSNLWFTGSHIKVKLVGGSNFVRDSVIHYAKQWEDHANIHFDFVTSGYADIRVGFESGGSWSYIGNYAQNIPQNQTTMNFGWLTDTTKSEQFSAVVLHEFGHALGFVHEHQTPATSIPWDTAAVYNYYRGEPNFWNDNTINHNIFRRYDSSSTVYSDFDNQSIMLYPIHDTLTIGDFEIGWNTTLSEMDKSYVGIIYPKNSDTCYAPSFLSNFSVPVLNVVYNLCAVVSDDTEASHLKDLYYKGATMDRLNIEYGIDNESFEDLFAQIQTPVKNLILSDPSNLTAPDNVINQVFTNNIYNFDFFTNNYQGQGFFQNSFSISDTLTIESQITETLRMCETFQPHLGTNTAVSVPFPYNLPDDKKVYEWEVHQQAMNRDVFLNEFCKTHYGNLLLYPKVDNDGVTIPVITYKRITDTLDIDLNNIEISIRNITSEEFINMIINSLQNVETLNVLKIEPDDHPNDVKADAMDLLNALIIPVRNGQLSINTIILELETDQNTSHDFTSWINSYGNTYDITLEISIPAPN